MGLTDLPDDALYVARCHCHEWVLAKAYAQQGGGCGECGGRPEFLSEYDGRPDWGRRR